MREVMSTASSAKTNKYFNLTWSFGRSVRFIVHLRSWRVGTECHAFVFACLCLVATGIGHHSPIIFIFITVSVITVVAHASCVWRARISRPINSMSHSMWRSTWCAPWTHRTLSRHCQYSVSWQACWCVVASQDKVGRGHAQSPFRLAAALQIDFNASLISPARHPTMKVTSGEFPDEQQRKQSAWAAPVNHCHNARTQRLVLPELPFCGRLVGFPRGADGC